MLSDAEANEIEGALREAVTSAGLVPKQVWGEQIENRGTQITFSALGQQAPLPAKSAWDPDFRKRQRVQDLLASSLPGYSVRLGGTTSIDITREGIDKAYGIHRLVEILDIGIDEMIFVGDALFPGGNDYPAYEAGVTSIRVGGPTDTKLVVEAIVASLS